MVFRLFSTTKRSLFVSNLTQLFDYKLKYFRYTIINSGRTFLTTKDSVKTKILI